MITPGGSPGTAFTKSATTRFNNSQIQAAQGTMPHNAAAQASLRKQSSGSNPSSPPVTPTFDPNVLQGGGAPQAPQPVNLPTGGTGLPPDAAEGFDPAVFQEQKLNEVVGTIRTQEFLNSPRVKDAASSVRLKNFFNNTNTERKPDSRNLLDQVLSRIGAK
jgi:hypothetical protein